MGVRVFLTGAGGYLGSMLATWLKNIQRLLKTTRLL
jgi:thioester reductase-like protein